MNIKGIYVTGVGNCREVVESSKKGVRRNSVLGLILFLLHVSLCYLLVALTWTYQADGENDIKRGYFWFHSLRAISTMPDLAIYLS